MRRLPRLDAGADGNETRRVEVTFIAGGRNDSRDETPLYIGWMRGRCGLRVT